MQMTKQKTLWESVIAQTQQAIDCGALQPIPTEPELIEQGEMRFLVRVALNLVRKDEAKKRQANNSAGSFNPFLPYDPDLFVADLTETHLCLLNKFNVVDYHLLIVTRAFEEQEARLNLQDFEALGICLSQIEGLGFYNSGEAAGASQRHKHLQLVPLPIAPEEGLDIPLERVLPFAQWQDTMTSDGESLRMGTIPSLPFVHAVIRFDLDFASPLAAAQLLFASYQQLLAKLGVAQQTAIGAYNLLVTRQWMLMVPRTQEKFEFISVNALGFAGTLFVRNQEQLQRLKAISPLKVLAGVAVPIDR
jgi:ATP adenylyltransferase